MVGQLPETWVCLLKKTNNASLSGVGCFLAEMARHYGSQLVKEKFLPSCNHTGSPLKIVNVIGDVAEIRRSY